MGQLENKTALMTGASTGIGLAIARRFAAEGATVHLTGRRKAELDTAVEHVGPRAVGIQGDVSRLGDLDRLFAEITERSGRLDIVVANAGVGDFGLLGEITPEDAYERTTAINLKGTVFTVQKTLPLLPPEPRDPALLQRRPARRAGPRRLRRDEGSHPKPRPHLGRRTGRPQHSGQRPDPGPRRDPRRR